WVVPVTLSFVFTPSPAARMFGFALQTTTGKPAGPWRCAARSFFAWLPFAMFFPFVVSTSLFGHAPGVANYWKSDFVLGTVIVVGIAYSIGRPARGFPDLLAGTCVVPR